MSIAPFNPIAKEQAAEILGTSIRTIENYVSTGLMPAPVAIGRRVYWHPDIFYGWLDGRLKEATSQVIDVKSATTAPIQTAAVHDEAAASMRRKAGARAPVAVGVKALKGAAARSNALIEQICNS